MKISYKSGGCLLVTGEEKSVTEYNPDFINQFDCIITSRDDINHPNVIRTHYLHPWRIKKTYDELSSINFWPSKSKNLSAIISNLQSLPIQQKRLSLMNKLKEHYGVNLSWYSKGQSTFLNDKWDGLAPFKYSIAIENSQHLNYFTEKISDCFLAHATPIYYGCPNINDFFEERSFIKMDIDDFGETVRLIDRAVLEDFYGTNEKYLRESRRLVLEKYHFIAALSNILQKYQIGPGTKSKIIRPQSYFMKGTIGKLIARIDYPK
jgi:hypothetical protein